MTYIDIRFNCQERWHNPCNTRELMRHTATCAPATMEGGASMPFEQLSDLPDSVQHVLPKHAQEIYRAAFNSAWQQYDQPGERRAGRGRVERCRANIYQRRADR